ncbi:MAG: hypothetical protein J0647_04290 [Campylobacteraceae bacterium]|nr:hypothetical protein [Campylobacteraceae bacterium]
MKKIFYPLFALLALIPLGLISENPAWAEWDTAYYQEVLGFVPKGINEAFNMKALMPDYNMSGINEVVAYYLSAFLGIALIFVFFYIIMIGKKVVK